MTYEVIDRRHKDRPKEACRVCGSIEVHTREYNKPTMKCIHFLRALIVAKNKCQIEGCEEIADIHICSNHTTDDERV